MHLSDILLNLYIRWKYRFLKYTLKIRNTIQEKIQHTFIQN